MTEFEKAQYREDKIHELGNQQPVDLMQMKKEIESAMTDLAPQFKQKFEGFQSQVDICLKWTDEAHKFVKEGGNKETGIKLLTEIDDDLEGDLILLD